MHYLATPPPVTLIAPPKITSVPVYDRNPDITPTLMIPSVTINSNSVKLTLTVGRCLGANVR